MSSPAFTTAYEDTTLWLRRAAGAFWTSLSTRNRDIATSLGISAAVHIALLIGVGTALYTAGEDDANIPELSVQLETREGPSSEEFTEAALPEPAPDPIQDVLDDPGTGMQTVDAAAMDFYIAYRQYTADATISGGPANQIPGGLEDIWFIVSGARIQF